VAPKGAEKRDDKWIKDGKDVTPLDEVPSKTTFVTIMNVAGILCGLSIFVAGAVGTYSGAQVIKIWPPLTWNVAVSGVFMALFGIFTMWICLFSNGLLSEPSIPGQQGSFKEKLLHQFGFLDTFLGRGVWFIFCGLRVIPLGYSFCLAAGLFTVLFGVGSIILHFIVSADVEDACTIMNYISIVVSIADVIAGCMGFYWGTSVIAFWPPLTWNNCVSGVFVALFGLITAWTSVTSKDPRVAKYIGFVDYFHGRGFLYIFCALRIIPLGQAACFIIGMVTLGFGMLNLACYFAVDVPEDGISAAAKRPELPFAATK